MGVAQIDIWYETKMKCGTISLSQIESSPDVYVCNGASVDIQILQSWRDKRNEWWFRPQH